MENEKGIPMNNNTLRQMEMYLRSGFFDKYGKSTDPSGNYEPSTNANDYYDFSGYRRFLLLQNYFVGLYTCEGDEDFKEIMLDFFKCAGFNGECALVEYAGKLLICHIMKKTYINGRVYDMTVKLYTPYGPDKQKNMGELGTFINGKNAYYFKGGIEPLPALWGYKDLLTDGSKYTDLFKNNMVGDSKRFGRQVNCNSEQVNKLEEARGSDISTPFVDIINPIALGLSDDTLKMTNTLQEFNNGGHRTNTQFQDFKDYINFELNGFGVRVNNDIKKERINSQESAMNEYNNVIIENITMHNLEMLSKQLKANGRTITFKKTVEMYLEQPENEEQEKVEENITKGNEVK